jgi:hypothetical protein
MARRSNLWSGLGGCILACLSMFIASESWLTRLTGWNFMNDRRRGIIETKRVHVRVSGALGTIEVWRFERRLAVER